MQTAAAQAHWPVWSDTRTGEECGKELNIPGIARPRPGHSAHIVARRGRNAIVLCLGGRRQHLVSPRHDRQVNPGTEYSYVCSIVCVIITMFHSTVETVSRVCTICLASRRRGRYFIFDDKNI